MAPRATTGRRPRDRVAPWGGVGARRRARRCGAAEPTVPRGGGASPPAVRPRVGRRRRGDPAGKGPPRGRRGAGERPGGRPHLAAAARQATRAADAGPGARRGRPRRPAARPAPARRGGATQTRAGDGRAAVCCGPVSARCGGATQRRSRCALTSVGALPIRLWYRSVVLGGCGTARVPRALRTRHGAAAAGGHPPAGCQPPTGAAGTCDGGPRASSARGRPSPTGRHRRTSLSVAHGIVRTVRTVQFSAVSPRGAAALRSLHECDIESFPGCKYFNDNVEKQKLQNSHASHFK